MAIRKLKVSETAGVLKQMVARQGHVCAVCDKGFTKTDGPVLDHCHKTGFIRGALHRSCNGGEGKVRVKAQWSHKGVTPDEFLIGLGKYLDVHKKPRYPLIYHSHKSDDEQRLAKNAKARRKRATAKKKA
ncbi:MAG: endonuclease domain-containing protein [Pseudomonadales bacterium]